MESENRRNLEAEVKKLQMEIDNLRKGGKNDLKSINAALEAAKVQVWNDI